MNETSFRLFGVLLLVALGLFAVIVAKLAAIVDRFRGIDDSNKFDAWYRGKAPIDPGQPGVVLGVAAGGIFNGVEAESMDDHGYKGPVGTL